MSRILEKLEPKEVFGFFEDISQIPRGSKNEKDISDYLVDFAKQRNLEVIQDEALNVIIRKSGTVGYENSPIIILQGHMDMVCEKNIGTDHDFMKDPLKLKIEDDFIMASGTTLGADNGIAVAYALALLDSKDILHPPLEVLITTDEETGMTGAIELNPDNLKGRILLNMDSGEEGILLTSCAGGIRNSIEVPVDRENIDDSFIGYNIKVRGLKGGHSGSEIDKERGNSNKIMGRVLNKLNSSIQFKLVEISGGAKSNAIPRESDSLILIKESDEKKLEETILSLERTIKNEFKASDPEIRIYLEKDEKIYKEAFSDKCTKKIIASLVLLPNGVQSMSMDIEGLVQSSNNVGVVTTTERSVTIENAIRSSIDSLKFEIVERIDMLANLLGVESESGSSYPSWSYKEDSYIRDIFIKSFKNKYGKDPKVTAIHAGLECGQFSEKFNGEIDMISFGPDMFDIHTPDEKLSISSTKRTWDLLLEILKSIK
ncbi:aminoacyl-histidine dipeptidase PepD [Gottschalkia acidurici 9a]|uniref:Cytosol non-specific dipeptidase n=1 Tax=Gottschalkia acidurici (strain ATCC 7906 / DSM 604 / BCRC 14475 / CIP 104303 / KCTC 5404 / NCIMB 10678 / 9a) TaxID=1128398 RepID=K0B2A9_GOTA9|nr:aminoacyl-histidine dipeptidase [Gottschalkia acidurici]AFS78771.1 aminoacyl-histidine dipeptidase PepD [Gottschalkia acidurici 9a]